MFVIGMLELKVQIIKELIVLMTALVALLQFQLAGEPGEIFLGGIEPVTEAEIVSTIENEQSNYFATNGKYYQAPNTKDGTYDKLIHEYVTPKGEAGYQVFLKKTENNKIYEKSVGYGPEATDRTYDWRFIKDLTIIASTTPQ